jgi:hypothetical protein
MTKNEMLLKLLAQSGWTATNEKDEDGYVICVASETERAAD